MFYITCPSCGANLDPGERCDCAGAIMERMLDKIELIQDKSEYIPEVERETDKYKRCG